MLPQLRNQKFADAVKNDPYILGMMAQDLRDTYSKELQLAIKIHYYSQQEGKIPYGRLVRVKYQTHFRWIHTHIYVSPNSDALKLAFI